MVLESSLKSSRCSVCFGPPTLQLAARASHIHNTIEDLSWSLFVLRDVPKTSIPYLPDAYGFFVPIACSLAYCQSRIQHFRRFTPSTGANFGPLGTQGHNPVPLSQDSSGRRPCFVWMRMVPSVGAWKGTSSLDWLVEKCTRLGGHPRCLGSTKRLLDEIPLEKRNLLPHRKLNKFHVFLRSRVPYLPAKG